MKSILVAPYVEDDSTSTHNPNLPPMDMVTEVWRNLPPDLLAPILAHLPWWSNLRLQPVCKAWSLLLRNSKLLHKFCFSPSECVPCCIVRTASGGAICNLTSKKWYPIPQFWPTTPTPNHTATSIITTTNLNDHQDEFQIVAAAAGVFLLEGRDQDQERYLFNPLNKSWKQLPPLPAPELGHHSTCTILGMAADPDSSLIRVIAEQTEYEEMDSTSEGAVYTASELSIMDTPPGAMKLCEIYVYDMKRNSNTWELATTLQSEIDLRLEIENAVLIGNDLYVLMVQPLGWCWMYRVFKAMAANWEEVPADITFDLGHVHLFEHRGSLMLVGGTDVMKSDKTLAVSIWRLEMTSSGSEPNCKAVWEQVITMPDELIKRLYMLKENGIFYHFDVEGDYACFINPFTEITITCDMVGNSWGFVDKHEYGDDFQYIDDLIFLFHPRLDVVL